MPMPSSPHTEKTLVRWRASDTPNGVTKRTVLHAAEVLGFTETQLIHTAVASFIAHTLPQYQADLSPISEDVYAAIRARVPQDYAPSEVLSSLIG